MMTISDAPDLRQLPSSERLLELMMDASRTGRDDMIPALLAAGVELNCRDARGYTPLILASYNGRQSTTQLLIGEGANVNAADGDRGNTALMGVAFKGYVPIARILMEAGADVNLRNAAGQTALMMAALFGQSAIVDMLLAAGADTQTVDAAGNHAASLADAQGNRSLAGRLQSAGGERG